MSAYDNTVDAVLFKHEDSYKRQPVGPVYVRKGGVWKNYEDSPETDWEGKPLAKWMTAKGASEVAKKLGLPFFEI